MSLVRKVDIRDASGNAFSITNPLNVFNTDFYTEVKLGNVSGYSIVHKFGAADLSTSFLPITYDKTYKTPTSNTALEFVSSDANDTSAGSGAREITIIGIQDSAGTWSEVTQTLNTNGTTAVALSQNLIRLYRWYVSSSGSYATESTGSHAGTLTIRVSGAGATWGTIPITPFARGQSEIGVYTVPSGKTAYLLSKDIFVDSVKSADVYFFQRPSANTVSAPYSAMRLFEKEVGIAGGYDLQSTAPKGPFVGPCDIGFMGSVSAGTANCSVEFELLLIDS